MLDPRDRRLLFDLFRPPDGFQLDEAIGTTYSLDLLTLLVTPLAFTMFDWEAKDGRIKASPVALLESLRRYSDRITIFHQADCLQAPKRHRLLFGYMEECLVPVIPKRSDEGVFHPKVWMLRFAPRVEKGRLNTTARYRLICSSRNMTFDRSWDAVLTLEGDYAPRSRRLPQNRPLREFLQGLPTLALRNLSPGVGQRVSKIADEIERVPFECPQGFDEVRFWPLGLGGGNPSFQDQACDRLLVVSPFVSDHLIKDLASRAKLATLVSRSEELNKLEASTFKHFQSVFALDPGAEIEPESEGDSQDSVDLGESDKAIETLDTDVVPFDQSTELSGLHAKLVITESKPRASIWIGSANATNAAYSSNVEFLVELEGSVSKCGIDKFLDPKRQTGFAGLLQEYVRTEHFDSEQPEEQLAKQFDLLQRTIARLPLRAVVTGSTAPETFDITLGLANPFDGTKLFSEIRVRCRPLSVRDAWYQEFTPTGDEIVFSQLHFDALTAFFVFEMTGVNQADVSQQRVARLFLVNIPLTGAPKDRKDRMLLSLLDNKQKILRYLLLLLSDEGWDAKEALSFFDESTNHARQNASHTGLSFDLPLLEVLVLSLARYPEKLDQVQRLVSNLSKTEKGREIIPDGLLEVWEPIWKVRQERHNVSPK